MKLSGDLIEKIEYIFWNYQMVRTAIVRCFESMPGHIAEREG
jgi:hypothetical protein